MIFRGEALPETTRAHFFGKPSAAATTLSTAEFARPRSAGALTRTFRASPIHPAIASRDEDGITLTLSLIVLPPRAVLCL